MEKGQPPGMASLDPLNLFRALLHVPILFCIPHSCSPGQSNWLPTPPALCQLPGERLAVLSLVPKSQFQPHLPWPFSHGLSSNHGQGFTLWFWHMNLSNPMSTQGGSFWLGVSRQTVQGWVPLCPGPPRFQGLDEIQHCSPLT